MTKYFGQWKVVKDGIETVSGHEYLWISKEDIMNKNTEPAKRIMDNYENIDNASLRKAFEYGYRYFHAMTRFNKKTHPDIYEEMMSEFKELDWYESRKGYTAKSPQGFNITVFRNDKNRWKWVYDDIYSKSSYKNLETAKKKAYASYFWLYEHITKMNE